MEYFVGLDVSLKETAICLVNETGDIIVEGSVSTEPKSIMQFLDKHALPIKRIGLEAGSLTPWLYHALIAAGFPAICLETRHASAALKAQNVKTDKNDARGLAHIMRTGWYKVVHVKSQDNQKLRVLLNNRKCLLDKRIDIQNQIRGTLKVFGLKTGEIGRWQYEQRIRDLIKGDPELESYVLPLLEARRFLWEQERQLERMILKIVKHDEVCRRFMTIPGVGPLTALVFKTTIDTPIRFQKSRDVGVHLGLTPRKYASGEINYNGRITKCGDPLARAHLFEAAKVLMSRTIQWSTLKAWGMQLAKRRSMKKACVAVARKLAIIMHRMWVDETEFRWGNPIPSTA